MGRISGLLQEDESLSIQYLINGVLKEHLTKNGAITHLINAREFLVNEGTVLDSLCPLTYELGKQNQAYERNVTKFKIGDLIVHHLSEYESVDKFESEMLRLFDDSPLAIAIPTFESFRNIRNEIYFPSPEELVRKFFSTYHVMLLSSVGWENGTSYCEVQDSAGKEHGVGGFVKIALRGGIITHFVEIKNLFCTPVNPKSKFKELIPYDHILYNYSVRTSIAHATMLAAKELITDSERESISKGLEQIWSEIIANKFVYWTDPEDVQTNIETALKKSIGEPAKKLQIARSLKDQVSTDFRLWCRLAIDDSIGYVKNLQRALVELALRNKALILPTYTANLLQRGQSVLLSQLLLAYVEQLDRDVARYNDCRVRLNFCPLGACALAGTYLPIDRTMTAHALGFTEPMRNSIDAVSDRDFVVEFLSANSNTANHLSRLAEDWLLWASEKFGFITPSSSVSTGCSIMQQKYPHPMELVRKKAARVIGCLTTVLNSNGLPSFTYNQDFREDIEPVYDSVKATIGMIELSREFAQHVTFNQDGIKKSLPARHLDDATLVNYLVKKGRPFRESMDFVDQIVGGCVSRGRKLEDLDPLHLKESSPDIFGEDLDEYLMVENSIQKFCSLGSTGPDRVDEQLNYWRFKLGMVLGT